MGAVAGKILMVYFVTLNIKPVVQIRYENILYSFVRSAPKSHLQTRAPVLGLVQQEKIIKEGRELMCF